MTIEEAEALDGNPCPILLVRPGMEPSGRPGVMYGVSDDQKHVHVMWDSDDQMSSVPVEMLSRIIQVNGPSPTDLALGHKPAPTSLQPIQITEVPLMRWYARPQGDSHELRRAPQLASWEKASDPSQSKLRAYLDDTEALLAASRIDGPWALRLDVGLPPERDLLDMGDLDNYAFPLAYRLRDPGLVSVWCTKQHSDQSFVRIEPVRQAPAPSMGLVVARTTVSTSTVAFKKQIHSAVRGASQLPAGPVRLELAFVVGPHRNWLNLWKPTIDSLGPLLGRTYPERDWHPLDGRITELGLHLTVDADAGNSVVVGISATQVSLHDPLHSTDTVLTDQAVTT